MVPLPSRLSHRGPDPTPTQQSTTTGFAPTLGCSVHLTNLFDALRKFCKLISFISDRQERVIRSFGEEVSRLTPSISVLFQTLKEFQQHGQPLGKKQKITHLEVDGWVSSMHDFVKLCFCVEILDPLKGLNVFACFAYGCKSSTILLESIQAVDNFATLDTQSNGLNKTFNVSTTTPFLSTYLEWAPGRVHNPIFCKFVRTPAK